MRFIEYISEKITFGERTYLMDYGDKPFFYFNNNLWWIDSGFVLHNGKVKGTALGRGYGSEPIYSHSEMAEYILPEEPYSYKHMVHGRIKINNDMIIDVKPTKYALDQALRLIKKYIKPN